MSQLLTKAKIQLLQKFPFFATLALRLEYREDYSISTACTDGKSIKYNPDFFGKMSLDEQIGVLAHEVMHPALLHHIRRGNRDPFLWNQACDYAINIVLRDAGVVLPNGVLYNPKYRNWSADKIYDEIKKSGGGGQGWTPGQGFAGGLGDVMDFPYPELNDIEALEQQKAVIEAYNSAKNVGSISGSIEKLVDNIRNPDIPYDVLLERLVSEQDRDDYSWGRPNRRYLSQGVYAPSPWNQTYSEVVLAIDTSGSITQEELENYAGAVNRIQSIISNTVHVIYCDSRIARVEQFDPGDEIKLGRYGGGGTDFRPPFNYVEEMDLDPKLFIYFTDGQCRSFPPDPGYDTVWLIHGFNKSFKPPFGETIFFNG